jgi:hypothetical protein|tara:strand:+ start:4154 stop:5044 length:891 start_codon:yes stop_codon:yes gene_type:complete
MPDVQLLGKTEVWLHGVRLDRADLPDIARTAARILSLPEDKVFVTDVRDALVVLDVLVPRVQFEAVAGKQDEVLQAIAQIAGVTVNDDAEIHSEGVLGIIGTTRAQAATAISEAERMQEGIRAYASGRVAIVATGGELADGSVKDTNFEAAVEILGGAGFEVVFGGTVGDSEREIAGRVASLVGEGFGLVITTGGVGAEDKDRTLEALQLLDPDLATAVLAHYTKGHGRHVKDAVRIGVASLDWTTIISLPGPTHEVRLALPVVVERLKEGTSPADLVEAIADPLRATLPVKKGSE